MSYIDTKFLNLLSTRLPKFKRKSDKLYNFRCPHCGDSKKSSNKARGFVYEKKNEMFLRNILGKQIKLESFSDNIFIRHSKPAL